MQRRSRPALGWGPALSDAHLLRHSGGGQKPRLDEPPDIYQYFAVG
jgi:hypothetical protein